MSERWTRWGSLKPLVARDSTIESVEPIYSALNAQPPVMPELQVRHFARAAKASAEWDSSRTIRGVCVPYGIVTKDLGGFVERYAPGSFGKSIAEDDVRALFNNNASFVLGRKSAETLRLEERVDGVHVEILAPDTSYANDLLTLMRRGDIDEMTSAFYVMEHHWETAKDGTRIHVVDRGKLIAASVSSLSQMEGAGCNAGSPAAARAAGKGLARRR